MTSAPVQVTLSVPLTAEQARVVNEWALYDGVSVEEALRRRIETQIDAAVVSMPRWFTRTAESEPKPAQSATRQVLVREYAAWWVEHGERYIDLWGDKREELIVSGTSRDVDRVTVAVDASARTITVEHHDLVAGTVTVVTPSVVARWTAERGQGEPRTGGRAVLGT